MYCVYAKKRWSGFSLIEIMIVVAIIAILTIWAIPNYTAAKAQAQLKACRENVLVIVKALEAMRVRHSFLDLVNKYSDKKENIGLATTVVAVQEDVAFPYLLENGYLEAVPRCPIGHTSTDGSVYDYSAVLCGWIGSGAPSQGSFIVCGSKHYINRKSIDVRWNFGDYRDQSGGGRRFKYGWYTGFNTVASQYDVQ